MPWIPQALADVGAWRMALMSYCGELTGGRRVVENQTDIAGCARHMDTRWGTWWASGASVCVCFWCGSFQLGAASWAHLVLLADKIKYRQAETKFALCSTPWYLNHIGKICFQSPTSGSTAYFSLILPATPVTKFPPCLVTIFLSPTWYI